MKQIPWYSVPCTAAMSRRKFVITTGSLAAAAVWSSRGLGAVQKQAKFSDYPFSLGVASGEPAPDSVVIWTRLAPKPLEGGGMPSEPVEVSWQVADDEAMTKVVRRGTTVASPDWSHSVHVEVSGLSPNRWYWYQFEAGGNTSPKGRTRTTPAANSMPDKLRFAFASCQSYEQGLFTAYDHMLKEDVDLVIHLGDYIYEMGPRPNSIRQHIGPELMSLQDYRNRFAQYKTDPLLQGMHATAPWLVTWDDHEFDNNCAGAISEERHVSREDFLARRARAYQAYYEHMPLRQSSLPHGPDMPIYRSVKYGRLADFFVLDTRQYRSDQPCGDGTRAPCDGMKDPNATVLGEAQEKWLNQGLTKSPAKWNVLAQQIMVARVDRTPGENVAYSMDQWPGYEMPRRRLLRTFHDQRVSNPVVIGGDIHSNWANNLIADFDDLDSKIVASEFVGTSISSGGDGTRTPTALEQILSDNPFVKFHNVQRGYVVCDVSPQRMQTRFRTLEYVTRPGSPVETRASFVVEDGKPGIVES
jgi:alkaline phosphatase D